MDYAEFKTSIPCCDRYSGDSKLACLKGKSDNESYICNEYSNSTNLWNACQAGRVFS